MIDASILMLLLELIVSINRCLLLVTENAVPVALSHIERALLFFLLMSKHDFLLVDMSCVFCQ